jgi:hypothetical protein
VAFFQQRLSGKRTFKTGVVREQALSPRSFYDLALARHPLEKRLTMLVIAFILVGCALTCAQFIRWQTAWVAGLYSPPATSIAQVNNEKQVLGVSQP